MTVPVPADGSRAPEQAARERVVEVEQHVRDLAERTLARAKKAKLRMAKDPEAHNAALALDDLIRELERARKRLVHDTYYADDAALPLRPGIGRRRAAVRLDEARRRHGGGRLHRPQGPAPSATGRSPRARVRTHRSAADRPTLARCARPRH